MKILEVISNCYHANSNHIDGNKHELFTESAWILKKSMYEQSVDRPLISVATIGEVSDDNIRLIQEAANEVATALKKEEEYVTSIAGHKDIYDLFRNRPRADKELERYNNLCKMYIPRFDGWNSIFYC